MVHTTGLVITWLVGLGIIYVGLAYLAKNEKNAAGFGLRTLPRPEARGWWQVKGIRDVTTGVLALTWIFLAPAQLGWLLLVLALIPAGDASIVMRGGNPKTALGIHGLTAVVMVIGSVFLLTG